MKSRFKARSTRMHVAGWMRKSLRSARCLTRQKIIFPSSADRTRRFFNDQVTCFSLLHLINRSGHPTLHSVPLHMSRTLICLKDNEISVAAAMHFSSKPLSQAVSWERNSRPCIIKERHVMHNGIFCDFGRQKQPFETLNLQWCMKRTKQKQRS